jgi:hypothetical protein
MSRNALFFRCEYCQQQISGREASTREPLEFVELCDACWEAGWRSTTFGECPICHGNDGCRSIGPDHWYSCDTHRTKWCIGSNLFSGWKELTRDECLQNAAHLAGYREVKPSRLASPEQIAREAASRRPPSADELTPPF